MWLLLTTASAATYVVCDDADLCLATLQEAVDAIKADGEPGTIGVLDAQPGQVVVIEDAPDIALDLSNITMTGNGVDPVFTVTRSAVTVSGATIAPRGARAFEVNLGSLDIESSQLTGVDSIDGNGGLVLGTDSDISLHYSVVIGGAASGDGGQVYLEGGDLYSRGTRFVRGTASGRGGLIAVSAGTFLVQEATLRQGIAGQSGGAVFTQALDSFRLQGVEVSDNDATDGGGLMVDAANIDIDNATIRSNTASREGGGAWLSSTDTVTVSNSVITDNLIFLGASDDQYLRGGGLAILNDQGTTSITETTLARNAAMQGGGVAVIADQLTIERSLLCANDATFYGAGYWAWDVRVASLSNNRWVANTAGEAGGAVHQDAGTITLLHNTFVGNRAPGGSVARVGGTADARNNILAFNQLEGGTFAADDHFPVGDGNLWWDNTPPRATGADTNPLDGDPLFRNPTLDCGFDGTTSFYGAGVNAADGQDRDQSPADFGIVGGPDADDVLWEDLDGDGAINAYDCSADPTIHPGAVDIPYDGIDSDCREDDDYDADHDGERPPVEVMEAALGKPVLSDAEGGNDCDDNDATRSSLHAEVDGNGIDDDCDGWADSMAPLGSVSCSHGEPGWAVVAWLARRR